MNPLVVICGVVEDVDAVLGDLEPIARRCGPDHRSPIELDSLFVSLT